MTHQIKNNEVPFTQYLRPNGQQVPVEIALDNEAVKKAQELLNSGFHFEAEVLMNGICSFAIVGYDSRIDELNDLVIKLCLNGPAVPVIIKQMIMDFNPNKVKTDE